MTIVIKNALPKEQEVARRILRNLEDNERKAFDAIGLAIKAANECEKCKEIEDAMELLRKAREPHLEVIRAIKNTTLIIE